MAKLRDDEIRSTIHLTRELSEKFEQACLKKYGADWKKKTGYKEAMQNFVNEVLGDDVVEDKGEPESPTQSTTESTEIVTSDNMTVEQKEAIAKKIADERKKKQQQIEFANRPPPFPPHLNVKSDDDLSSFLSHVSRDRKIRITRIEID